MAAAIRLGSVSLDCENPHDLAEFYARLLGAEVTYDSETFSAIQLGGVWLSMQRADEYVAPTWPDPATPQQLHLDFAVDDLDTAEQVAVAAGARKAAEQPSPERWRVLIDPAGHPFCLSTLIPE
jgi:uncharacterized glyoxalase superfamily protein PhnB